MEVSRLTFESKTQAALQNPVLTAKRKKELRFKALKEWIEAHPYGTPLSGKEFKRVGNFSSDISANSWLWRQSKNGKLIKHEEGYKSFYTIPGKVTTRKLEPPKEPEMDKFPTANVKPAKSYTFAQLEQMAMTFDFYASGNATVPGFLMYIRALE